jgi:hypothetical protein
MIEWKIEKKKFWLKNIMQGKISCSRPLGTNPKIIAFRNTIEISSLQSHQSYKYMKYPGIYYPKQLTN